MNDSLNLYDLLTDYLLLNYFFHNLRHFNYLFDNPWHYNNFLYYLFYFNYFWYFHHFFNNLLNFYSHFFDPVHDYWNFYDFLLDILYKFRDFYEHINKSFNFYYFRLFDDHGFLDYNFFDVDWLYPGDHWFFNDDFFDDWNFLNNGYFYVFLYFLGNLLNDFNNFGLDSFYFFDHFLDDQLFPDDFYFFDLSGDVVDLFDDLNLFDNLLYSLLDLDQRNYLLYYTVDHLILGLYMILHLSRTPILNHWHDLLNDFLDFYNLRHFNNFLYYSFHIDWNFNNFFNDFLNRNYFLLHQIYFFDFSLNVVDYSFILNRFFHLHYFFSNHFYLHYLRHYLFHLYQFLHNCRHFYNSLNLFLIWNQLFSLGLYDHGLFNWNMNNFLNFLYFLDLNNFLDLFLHSHHLWHFDNPLNYLLDNLLHLHDLGSHSEHFQDVIHVNYVHDLSSYHANHSLVNFQD